MQKAKYDPQRRYDATNTVHVPLKLNRKTDADIIALLEMQPSKQGYIKAAIRARIDGGAKVTKEQKANVTEGR